MGHDKSNAEFYSQNTTPQNNEQRRSKSILYHTKTMLGELDYANIYIPNRNVIKIIQQLKDTPRTGKLIRLKGFKDPVTNTQFRVRSVYDHIISLSYSADILLPIIANDLENNKIDIAKCIAYHDICETLLGDIPDYTKMKSESNQRLAALELLKSKNPNEIKQTANLFIGLFLENRERTILKHTETILFKKPPTPISNFIQILDKTDPIIAVWQYIYFFGKIQSSKFDIVVFVERLRDFFENSKVKEVSLKCTRDKRIAEFINKLQDMSLAEEYYSNCGVLTKIIADVKLPKEIKSIIENNVSLDYLSELHKHQNINGENSII